METTTVITRRGVGRLAEQCVTVHASTGRLAVLTDDDATFRVEPGVRHRWCAAGDLQPGQRVAGLGLVLAVQHGKDVGR